MKHRYRFKLLTGPLAGRQLTLPEGDFTIGGNDPDLDAKLEGGHIATLTVTEEGVGLVTRAPCWIGGKAVDPPPERVPLGVALDIGGLVLVFGEGETAIPELAVPARHDARQAAWSSTLIAVCLVLVVSGTAGGAMWAFGHLRSQADAAAPDGWMEAWRQKAQRSGIKLERHADGMAELTGNCLIGAERNALARTLREHNVIFRDTTQCQDELVRNVQAVLNLHGFADARVESGERLGTVTISGRIHADGRWQRTVGMLSSMRGLEHWTVEDSASASVKVLIEMLRDAGLIGRLSVARDNGLILITGVLDAGAQRMLASILSAFSSEHPKAPKAIFQNIPTSSIQAGIFPSPIVSFGGSSEMAFLDLANGTRLKVGSRLPTGYVIVGIDRNGIDLEREGELMHLPLEL